MRSLLISIRSSQTRGILLPANNSIDTAFIVLSRILVFKQVKQEASVQTI